MESGSFGIGRIDTNKLPTLEIYFKVVFKKSEYRCVKYYILQGERQAFTSIFSKNSFKLPRIHCRKSEIFL